MRFAHLLLLPGDQNRLRFNVDMPSRTRYVWSVCTLLVYVWKRPMWLTASQLVGPAYLNLTRARKREREILRPLRWILNDANQQTYHTQKTFLRRRPSRKGWTGEGPFIINININVHQNVVAPPTSFKTMPKFHNDMVFASSTLSCGCFLYLSAAPTNLWPGVPFERVFISRWMRVGTAPANAQYSLKMIQELWLWKGTLYNSGQGCWLIIMVPWVSGVGQ